MNAPKIHPPSCTFCGSSNVTIDTQSYDEEANRLWWDGWCEDCGTLFDVCSYPQHFPVKPEQQNGVTPA